MRAYAPSAAVSNDTAAVQAGYNSGWPEPHINR